jgi:hypothetical protein
MLTAIPVFSDINYRIKFYLIVILNWLCACSHIALSRYDAVTVLNLKKLQPSVNIAYASFKEQAIDESANKLLSDEIGAALDYEKRKGEANVDMVHQVEIIQAMYSRHVSERTSQGKWTLEYSMRKKSALLTAIDTAIETENLKNN